MIVDTPSVADWRENDPEEPETSSMMLKRKRDDSFYDGSWEH